MKKYFRTIQNVMDSRWGNFQYAGIPAAQKTDRVLQSSKLEDCIYRDLSKDDENLETIQQEAAPKLHSFPALSRDIFQSFYSLFPKRTDADRLTAEAQKFNAKLLDHVTGCGLSDDQVDLRRPRTARLRGCIRVYGKDRRAAG